MRAIRPEGELERLARQMVAEELGVEVERYDYGTAPAQVDALIRGLSGDVPMEVVSDNDVLHLRQWKALMKHGSRIGLPEGDRSWYASLEHRGDIRVIANLLPDLLRVLDREEMAEYPYRLTDQLRAIGISSLHPMPGVGELLLSPKPWFNWDRPIPMNDWVDRVFAQQPDLAHKLEIFGGPPGVAFIWLSLGAAMSVEMILTGLGDLPFDGPQLPPAVGEVWVATTMRGHPMARFAKGAWTRTATVTHPPS